MNYKVVGSPAYSVLEIELQPGETVTAEAGAMMAMEGDVMVQTSTAGGLIRGILRRLTVGESLFLNTFKAGLRGGRVLLAPGLPGDIKYIELKGEGLLVQDTGYLAHHGDVDYSLTWRGLKGLLAEGNLIWMRLHGTGGVWVNSYGAIIVRELKPGETMTVDNFHLVAMEDTIDFIVKKFGGWKSFILGGEGLVVEVKGPGKVYMQTRTLPPLAEAVARFLPEQSEGGGPAFRMGGFRFKMDF